MYLISIALMVLGFFAYLSVEAYYDYKLQLAKIKKDKQDQLNRISKGF